MIWLRLLLSFFRQLQKHIWRYGKTCTLVIVYKVNKLLCSAYCVPGTVLSTLHTLAYLLLLTLLFPFYRRGN